MITDSTNHHLFWKW